MESWGKKGRKEEKDIEKGERREWRMERRTEAIGGTVEDEGENTKGGRRKEYILVVPEERSWKRDMECGWECGRK